MIRLFKDFIMTHRFGKIFSRKKTLEVSEMREEYAQKIYSELRKILVNDVILEIVMVYSNFLFENNKNDIEKILSLMNLDKEVLNFNDGISIILVKTQAKSYFYVRIINDEITERKLFLTGYNIEIEQYFNNHYILFDENS